MMPARIARRLVEKHGTAYAYGLCRGRVKRAGYLGRWHLILSWRTIGELVEKMGNAQGWA
jgi:hypothetical protein